MAKHRGFRVITGKVDLTRPMVSTYFKNTQVLRRLPTKNGFVSTKKSQEVRALFSALSFRYGSVFTDEQKENWEFYVYMRRPSAYKITKSMSNRWPGGLRRQRQTEYRGSGLNLYIASNILAYKSDMNIPRDKAPNPSVSRPIFPLPLEWKYENGEVIIVVEIPEQDKFYKEIVLRVIARFRGGFTYIRSKNGKKKRVLNSIPQHIVAKERLAKWPSEIEVRFSKIDGGKIYNHKKVSLKELISGVLTFNLDIVGAEGPDVGPLVSKSSDACSVHISENMETAKKISDKFFKKFNSKKGIRK